MLDCRTDKYAEIYKPWLENAEELVHLACIQPDDRVLDLCGGSGAVAQEALKRTPHVELFDLNPRSRGIPATQGDAHEVSASYMDEYFDVIICRQAMGYLTPELVAPQVHKILRTGGRFVFNIFNKPMGVFKMKTTKRGAEKYVEARIFLFNRVWHLQTRTKPSLLWDVSMFKYHKLHDVVEALKPYFDVKVKSKGQSYHLICTKRHSACKY